MAVTTISADKNLLVLEHVASRKHVSVSTTYNNMGVLYVKRLHTNVSDMFLFEEKQLNHGRVQPL